MSKIRTSFLFVIGLLAILGFNSINANAADDKNKRPKNTGILSVKTTPESYPVKVDGQVVGMSGTVDPAEFYLAPGIHQIEVGGPNGRSFTKEIDIAKDKRNCICLKIVENTIKRPCPYDVRVDGPESVIEGDLITFASINSTTATAVPLNYVWRVSPETARITSGLGTQSITVDTSGLGSQTVSADLDVSDGSPDDAKCRQLNSVKTTVAKPPEKPKAYGFDKFVSKSFDDDKARLDSLAVELQNQPDAQAYIILYQGTDKNSVRRNADLLSQRAVDYLVKVRGVDPRRIVVTKWGTLPQTTYDIWIVPPGAQPPVPQN